MNESTSSEVKGFVQENTGTIIMNFGAPTATSPAPAPLPAPSGSTIDFEKHHLGELLKKNQFKVADRRVRKQLSLIKELEEEKKARQALEAKLDAVETAQQELARQLQLLKLRNFNQLMMDNFKGK